MSLHKVRTEVEEIKHDLNTYEIEHHVLEGKLIDQEQTIANLKQQVSDLKQGKLETFASEIQNIDKKIVQVAKKQDKILSDIRQLSSHANETTTALAQYKEKITQFEKAIAVQKEQIQDIVKLREGLAKLTNASELSNRYVVQPGDSLEKIARVKGTSVEAIKQTNNLSTDLIVVGQEILLP
ncbi:LysM peptidoglycan-binding domain-containing protein [Simkania negevensis]|nr:LysM peptidoglycan-binding domain-containing protein [Simkania negevensis]